MSEDNYIINCVGETISIGDVMPGSSKCLYGYTEEYLYDNESFLINDWEMWELFSSTIILVPIYAASENFIPTVKNILTQDWQSDIDIILYVNEPKGAVSEETSRSLSAAKSLIEEQKNNTNVLIRLVYEQIDGGINMVYRKCFTTVVALAKRHIDSKRITVRKNKSKELSRLLKSLVYLVIDDDTICIDTKTLPAAVEESRSFGSAVLGGVTINSVVTPNIDLNPLLQNLINLFFRFKHLVGSLILTPRGGRAYDLLNIEPVDIEAHYADTLWIAQYALHKKRAIVPVWSSIHERPYPSNAQIVYRLRRFLEGEDNNAFHVYENIAEHYGQDDSNKTYKKSDIDELVRIMKTRDLHQLTHFCDTLIKRDWEF